MYRRGALVDKLCLIAYGNERTHQAASGSLLLAHGQYRIIIHRQLAGIGQHHILPGIHPGIVEHQTALVHRQQVGVQHTASEGVLRCPEIRSCRHDDGARRHAVILDIHSGAALAVERADDTGPLAVIGRVRICPRGISDAVRVTVRRHPAVLGVGRRDDQVDLAGAVHLLQRVLVLHAADTLHDILSFAVQGQSTQRGLAVGNRGQHLRCAVRQRQQGARPHFCLDIQRAAARCRIQRTDRQHRSRAPGTQALHARGGEVQRQLGIVRHGQRGDAVARAGDAQCTARGIQRGKTVAVTQLDGRVTRQLHRSGIGTALQRAGRAAQLDGRAADAQGTQVGIGQRSTIHQHQTTPGTAQAQTVCQRRARTHLQRTIATQGNGGAALDAQVTHGQHAVQLQCRTRARDHDTVRFRRVIQLLAQHQRATHQLYLLSRSDTLTRRILYAATVDIVHLTGSIFHDMGQHLTVELRGALRSRTVQLPACTRLRGSRAAHQRVGTCRVHEAISAIGAAVAIDIRIVRGARTRQRHILRATQGQRAVVGDDGSEGSPGQLQRAIIHEGVIDRGILQRQLVGIRGGHRSTTHACTAHLGVGRGSHSPQHQLAVTRDIARDGRTAQRQRTRARGIDGVATRAHSAHRGIRRGVHRTGQHQFIVTRDIARDGRTAQRQRTRARGIDGVATRAHSAHRGIRRGVHRTGQHQFIVTRDIARDGRTAQRQYPGARGIHRQGTGACAAHRRRRRGDRRTGQHQLVVARNITRDGSVRQRHRSGAVSSHRSTTYARTAHAPAIRMGGHQRAAGDGGDHSGADTGCRSDGQCTSRHGETACIHMTSIHTDARSRDAAGSLFTHLQVSGVRR